MKMFLLVILTMACVAGSGALVSIAISMRKLPFFPSYADLRAAKTNEERAQLLAERPLITLDIDSVNSGNAIPVEIER